MAKDDEIYDNDLVKKTKTVFDKILKAQRNFGESMVDMLEEIADNVRKKQIDYIKDIASIKRKELEDEMSFRKSLGELISNINNAEIEKRKDISKIIRDRYDFEKQALSELDELQKIIDQKRKDTEEEAKENIKEMGKSMLSTLGVTTSMSNAWKTLSKSIEAGMFYMTAIAMLVKLSVDRFAQLDKAAEKFREETGLNVDQSEELRKNVELIHREYATFGVTVEKAYSAQKALVSQFQSANLITKDTTEFVTLLSVNLGVAEDTSSKVLSNFMGLGNLSEDVSKNMIRVASKMSDASGISLNLVMRDVAESSSTMLNMVGSSPAKLLKSAFHARMLGINLEIAANNSRKLLNFNESIDSELEASVLLGKNLNFNSARRLAYEGKVVESQQEALKIMKSAGDFEKMSVFQRESLAKAAGMDLDVITKMLSREKAIEKVRQSGTKEEKERLESYLKQQEVLEKQKENADDLLINEIKSSSELEKKNRMMGKISKITNAFESIGNALADIFLPLINVIGLVADGISAVSEGFGKFTSAIGLGEHGIGGFISASVGFIASLFSIKLLLSGISKIGGVFGPLFGKNSVASSNSIMESSGKSMGGFFNSISKGIEKISFTSMAKAALGLIIISGGIWLFAKSIKEFVGIEWKSVWIGLGALTAFAAVMGILGIGPIAAAIGLGALTIAGVGLSLMVFASGASALGVAMKSFDSTIDQLTRLGEIAGSLYLAAGGIYAISAALASFAIGQTASGIGSFVGKLFGGDQIEKLERLANIAPRLQIVGSSLEKINEGLTDLRHEDSKKEKSTTSTEDVVNKLNELISLMKNGGISVNIDGKRISRELSVATT